MQPEQGPPLLRVRALTKSFGSVAALNAVDVEFRPGEYFCILGPSGCGKTTLLRLIAGFDDPTSGEIELNGDSILPLPPERRPVNMVFQQYALFPHMSVFDNVAFGLTVKKVAGETVNARVAETLRLVRLDEQSDRYPRQLSGGQQQRVALARALVNHPRVLLLDEPLAALDEKLRVLMQRELKQIQRQLGITFIHVTHSQDEALTLSDRLAVMSRGEIIQVGDPRDVYDRPANRFVAEFLGSSNLVRARAADRHGWITSEDGLLLQIRGSAPAAAAVATTSGGPGPPASPDGRGLYLIRPEHVRLARQRPAATANVLEGKVEEVRQAGPKTEYVVQVGAARLTAHVFGEDAREAAAEGGSVFVSIAPEHIVLLPEESASR